LTEALKHDDAPTRLFFLRADVREKAGDMPGAARDRAEALSRTPSDSLSWNARGYARMKSDPRGALADFDRAIELNPRRPERLINKANVLSEQLNRPDEAIQVYGQILEQLPEDLDTHGSRGVVLARLGRVEEARGDAEFCVGHTDAPFFYFQA